jgi:hypothetical protein
MAQGVVVATRYDRATRVTYQWANDLVRDLQQLGHAPVFMPVSTISSAAFSQAISTYSPSDFVIFYGHGEADRLIGQPSWLSVGSGPTLVDETTVNVFRGLSVYTVCCYALCALGSAYAFAYPQGAFISYESRFGFSPPNERFFKPIVNNAAIDFVKGNSPAQIINDLKNNWQNLSDDFLSPNGSLNHCQDAFLAGFSADTNSRFVGKKP